MNSDLLLLMGLMATFTLSLSAAGYLVMRPRRVALDRLRRLHQNSQAQQLPVDLGVMVAGAPVDSKKAGALRRRMLKAPLSMAGAYPPPKPLPTTGASSGPAPGL